MKTKTKTKEISYFRLKLATYLNAHFPEMLDDKSFLTSRAEQALTAYCDAVSQGFNHMEAESISSEVLYRDLYFSKYDTIVSVLENEFDKELPSPLPERLAPILIKNKAVQGVFAQYDLTDDFASTPAYDALYTELTGTIVMLMEAHQLPTIA